MKIVGRYENAFSANLAKGMLENNGIESWVLNPNQAYITGITNTSMLGIELAVNDKDYDEASKLIAASSKAL